LNGRAISLTIVAFVLGALAAGGVSVRVIREVKTVDDATSLPPSNIAPEAVTETLAPFAVTIPFVLSEAEPVVEIGFGYTAELVRVVEQSQNTIVQVQVTNADPSRTGLYLSGAGPGWGSDANDADLGGRTTLTWSGGAFPDEIPLRAADVLWLPIDGEFAVGLDGGQ